MGLSFSANNPQVHQLGYVPGNVGWFTKTDMPHDDHLSLWPTTYYTVNSNCLIPFVAVRGALCVRHIPGKQELPI